MEASKELLRNQIQSSLSKEDEMDAIVVCMSCLGIDMQTRLRTSVYTTPSSNSLWRWRTVVFFFAECTAIHRVCFCCLWV